MFKDVFVQLLQEKGINTNILTKETGLSNGMISKWARGAQMPSAENLIKLSNYFGVSIDYLLDRPSPSSSFIPSESSFKHALNIFKSLSPDERKAFIQEAIKHL